MIEFPDVSHYQAGLQLTGATACIAKSTEGTGFVDPSFGGFRAQAARLTIPFSAYHWINTADPVAQARACFAVAGTTPVMWDAEADGATVPRILAATAELKRLGGHAWSAYLPHWWWQDHLGSPDLRPLAGAGLALVSSDYRTQPAGTGWLPYGGMTPSVWQFTDARPFNGQSVDFNRYQGTVADLAALFSGKGGPSVTQPADIWGFVINSPALGKKMPAAEWIKFTLQAANSADAAVEILNKIVASGGTSQDAIAIIAAIKADGELTRAALAEMPTTIAKAVADETARRMTG